MANRKRRPTTSGWPPSDLVVWVVAGVVTVVASVLFALVVLPAITDDDGDEDSVVTAADAAFLYERNCGTCHGLEGQGNIGPTLADGAMVTAYPDIEDQIEVIADGRDAMPPFADSLTKAEIRAVAEYTREL